MAYKINGILCKNTVKEIKTNEKNIMYIYMHIKHEQDVTNFIKKKQQIIRQNFFILSDCYRQNKTIRWIGVCAWFMHKIFFLFHLLFVVQYIICSGILISD